MEYLFNLAMILFVAKLLSVGAKKLNLPEVVGMIFAGLLLGPSGFSLVKETDFIDKVAEIGVILLMFEAGLETDLKQLKETGLKSTLIACAGVFVPVLLGTVLFMCFYGFGPFGSEAMLKGLFVGTIMAATSVSITVAVLKELGVLTGKVGTTITGAAIIDDVIGIVVLTLVMSMKDTSTNVGIVILKATLFFALAIGLGIIIYRTFAWLSARYSKQRRISIASLVYCLIMAYMAETYFGIADITGAYVAGVVLCNLDDSTYIERRIEISSYMIFAPVFFASIGLKTSFHSMNLTLFLFSIAFVLASMLGKVIGCGGTARLLGFNQKESLQIGSGMMARGEVALITAQKGLAIGLLTSEFFTPVIFLILVSSFVTPIALKKLFGSKA
ncbi:MULTISPECIES: cation:proton antiporter [Terrabacteria group]|uniref:cation:proton antiporter n=1 Tax=Bacillati TaxID=1783272 RepID=UPI001C6E6C5C|nr:MULTISPECIES: cation:proton antiporter [Terrabacteria group]MBW9212672.1 cation:proton antiporter [Trueperella sp. zg.1013]